MLHFEGVPQYPVVPTPWHHIHCTPGAGLREASTNIPTDLDIVPRSVLRILRPARQPFIPVLDKCLHPLIPRLHHRLLLHTETAHIRFRHIILRRKLRLARNALLNRQDIKLWTGQNLIPVGGRAPVITQMVGMSRLHCDLDPLVEAYRVRQMPAVADLVIGDVFFVDDGPAEGYAFFCMPHPCVK